MVVNINTPIKPHTTTRVDDGAHIDLYPVQHCTFHNTIAQPEEDTSVAERMRRLQDQYDETGMRRSVDAAIVCHDHGVPCVLTFQIANDFFKLPGGYLDPSEDDVSGLKRHLDELLGTSPGTVKGKGVKKGKGVATTVGGGGDSEGEGTGNGRGSGSGSGSDGDTSANVSANASGAADASVGEIATGENWAVRDVLAIWWRPNFDGFFYPYKPAHVSQPKERRKIFLVTMTPEQMLGVPLNMKLLAIPIHEFYDNTQRYGPQLSALPHLLSRITFSAKP